MPERVPNQQARCKCIAQLIDMLPDNRSGKERRKSRERAYEVLSDLLIAYGYPVSPQQLRNMAVKGRRS